MQSLHSHGVFPGSRHRYTKYITHKSLLAEHIQQRWQTKLRRKVSWLSAFKKHFSSKKWPFVLSQRGQVLTYLVSLLYHVARCPFCRKAASTHFLAEAANEGLNASLLQSK